MPLTKQSQANAGSVRRASTPSVASTRTARSQRPPRRTVRRARPGRRLRRTQLRCSPIVRGDRRHAGSGIGATAAIFSALDAVVLSVPFDHPERIVNVSPPWPTRHPPSSAEYFAFRAVTVRRSPRSTRRHLARAGRRPEIPRRPHHARLLRRLRRIARARPRLHPRADAGARSPSSAIACDHALRRRPHHPRPHSHRDALYWWSA